MILAFDSSSAACTSALFDERGNCIAHVDEEIGRGHAERLVPMIAEMMQGRSPAHIVVGVGPGSFTGIRVAIAAAHGLAIGWKAKLAGMNSLCLLAAATEAEEEVAAAVAGGHGELFVQQFDGRTLLPTSELRNAAPAELAPTTTARLVAGSGAGRLIESRGWGEAGDAMPSARFALRLPDTLRNLPPKPVYARAPDARIPEAA